MIVDKNSLPRASGGVSAFAVSTAKAMRSSPRKRGCFRPSRSTDHAAMVFPAQAGVFPKARTRGTSFRRSSPRKRGCFLMDRVGVSREAVFPAQAGVFL